MSAGGGGAAGAAGGGAAAAGQAGGDAAQQGRANGDGDAQNGHSGLDAAQVNDALAALQGGQEELRALFAQQGEPPAGELDGGEGLEAGDGHGLDLGFLDGEEGHGEPQWDGGDGFDDGAAAELAAGFADAAERFIAPLAHEVDVARQEAAEARKDAADLRRSTEYADLVRSFPELGEPGVVESVTQLSRTFADSIGQPELGLHPQLIRMTYLAVKALEHAEGEEDRGEDPGAAHLEGGGGAVHGSAPPADAFDRMLHGGARGHRALPFGPHQ